MAADLAARFPDAEVIGTDHSPDAIADAIQRHPDGRAEYRVADILHLPFGDDSFGAVRCERVTQHLTEPDKAIAELVRVLRPRGRLLLIDTDWDSMLPDGSSTLLRERTPEVIAILTGQVSKGDRTAGRTLHRRMIQTGLTDVQAEPVTLVFDVLADANQLLPLDRHMVMGIMGDHPAAGLCSAWLDALDECVADHTFLATLTIWVASGSKAGVPQP
ncbi:methyltransferase domain-containing protein [Actinoplanes sp. RD1]|uniref:methyltransferase domain-containing protein n=1 Tax=Actinoplanes sp. RD1 TaxID=3064538 RepID=UPI00355670EB